MIRALKAALIVVGVIEILLGLSLVFVPGQAASGVSEVSGYLIYIMASLGICLIVFGVFLIVAARDPLRHINWVKYAIVLCILGALAGLYSVVQGAVGFSQAGMQIIMDAVFAVVFLALYPYKAAKGG
jgi:O-antigen/teichoic acid export membrane protein